MSGHISMVPLLRPRHEYGAKTVYIAGFSSRTMRCGMSRETILRWYGTRTDIEGRKRAEQALRLSEAYLAESQRLTSTCSWAVDGKNRELTYWSDAMFRVYGFDPERGFPSRERIWERIHPEDRAAVKENSDKVFREKVDCEFEYRLVLPSGIVRHIHALARPVLNGEGELIEVVGTDIDVTERKRAEAALRRNQAYLAEAQRLSHTGSFAYDPKTGKTLYWSEELCRIFGLDPQRGTPDLRLASPGASR